ncbi:hypothetical protein ACWGLP_00455 [Streptomyces lydicus]
MPHGRHAVSTYDSTSSTSVTALVTTRLKRMQYRPSLIDGFITKTRLDFSLP